MNLFQNFAKTIFKTALDSISKELSPKKGSDKPNSNDLDQNADEQALSNNEPNESDENNENNENSNSVELTSDDFSSNSHSFSLDVEIVSENTFLPGTSCLPGTSFIKTWVVCNTGTHSWPEGIKIVVFGQEVNFSCPEHVLVDSPLGPGENKEISLYLVAPKTPGHYVEKFSFATSSGQLFGPFFSVDINVTDEENFDWDLLFAESLSLNTMPPSDEKKEKEQHLPLTEGSTSCIDKDYNYEEKSNSLNLANSSEGNKYENDPTFTWRISTGSSKLGSANWNATDGNILLSLSPKPDENKIILNSWTKEGWGAEESFFFNNIPGPLELIVKMNKQGFEIYIPEDLNVKYFFSNRFPSSDFKNVSNCYHGTKADWIVERKLVADDHRNSEINDEINHLMSIWKAELKILSEIGFKDPSLILPELISIMKTPSSGNLNSSPDFNGIENVISRLLSMNK